MYLYLGRPGFHLVSILTLTERRVKAVYWERKCTLLNTCHYCKYLLNT